MTQLFKSCINNDLNKLIYLLCDSLLYGWRGFSWPVAQLSFIIVKSLLCLLIIGPSTSWICSVSLPADTMIYLVAIIFVFW